MNKIDRSMPWALAMFIDGATGASAQWIVSVGEDSQRDGRVYATLAADGNVGTEFLYAFDSRDGSIPWKVEDVIKERTTETSAFAPNGDPLLIGENADGDTVKSRVHFAPGGRRLCSTVPS